MKWLTPYLLCLSIVLQLTHSTTLITESNRLVEETIVFVLSDGTSTLQNRLSAAKFSGNDFSPLPIDWQSLANPKVTTPALGSLVSTQEKAWIQQDIASNTHIQHVFYEASIPSANGTAYPNIVVVYQEGSFARFQVTETAAKVVLTAVEFFSSSEPADPANAKPLPPTEAPQPLLYSDTGSGNAQLISFSFEQGASIVHANSLAGVNTQNWHYPLNLQTGAQAVIATTATGAPLLFMSNGFNENQPSNHALLHIIDLTAGTLIRSLVLPKTSSSVNGLLGISAMDLDHNGRADFILGGDWQGQLWVIDIRDGNAMQWQALDNQPVFQPCNTAACYAYHRLPIEEAPTAVFHRFGADFSIIFTANSAHKKQGVLSSVAVSINNHSTITPDDLLTITAQADSKSYPISEKNSQLNELALVQLQSGWQLTLPEHYTFTAAALPRQGLLHQSVAYQPADTSKQQAMLLSVYQDDGNQFMVSPSTAFQYSTKTIDKINVLTLEDQTELVVLQGEKGSDSHALCEALPVGCIVHKPPTGRLSWQRLYQ